MGLDITFFKKTDNGFEDIAYYRNTWELLNWVKLHKFDERDSIQEKLDSRKFKQYLDIPEDIRLKMEKTDKILGREDEIYDLYRISSDELENLVDRAERTIEEDPKINKFSGGYCPLPRTDVEKMEAWNDAEMDDYLNDIKSYIDNFKGIVEDVYIYMSY